MRKTDKSEKSQGQKEIFDTHRFLFTLNYENKIKGHKVLFVDRNNIEKIIELEKIEIGASPISCKLFDIEGKRYIVPFLRIRKVFFNNELIWDNSDVNLLDVKVIKSYKKEK